jgi:hypothetical protein
MTRIMNLGAAPAAAVQAQVRGFADDHVSRSQLVHHRAQGRTLQVLFHHRSADGHPAGQP